MEDLQRDHTQRENQNALWRGSLRQAPYQASGSEEAAEAAPEAETARSLEDELRPLKHPSSARATSVEIKALQAQVAALEAAQENLRSQYREKHQTALAELCGELEKKFTDNGNLALQSLEARLRREHNADIDELNREQLTLITEAENLAKDELKTQKEDLQKRFAEDLSEALNKQKTELKEKFRVLHKQILQEQANKLDKDHVIALNKQEEELKEQFRVQHKQILQHQAEKLAKDQTEALKKQKKDTETAHQQAVREKTLELQTARTGYDEHIVSLKNAHEEEFRELQTVNTNALQEQLQTLEIAKGIALANQKSKFDQEVLRVLREQESSLKKEHQNDIDAQKREHQNAIDAEKKAHQNAIDAEKKAHQNALDAEKDESRKALDAQRGDHQRVLDVQKKENQNAIDAQAKEHQNALDSYKKEHQAVIDAQKAEHQTAHQKALDAQKATLQDEYERILDAHVNERQAVHQKALDAQKATLQDEHRRALDVQKATLAQQQDAALQKQKRQLNDTHAQMLAAETQRLDGIAKSNLQHQEKRLLEEKRQAMSKIFVWSADNKKHALLEQEERLQVKHAVETEQQRIELGAELNMLRLKIEGLEMKHRLNLRVERRRRKNLLIENKRLGSRSVALTKVFGSMQDQYNEELHNKTRQQYRALRQLRCEKETVIAELNERLEDMADSVEIAKRLYAQEVSDTDTLLDKVRSRLEDASRHIGFTFPSDETIDQRAYNVAFYGKLLVSRMYRRPVEKLSHQLGLRMEAWPTYGLPPSEHNNQVRDILDRHVDAVMSQFKQLTLRIEEEEQRTENVRKAWIVQMLDALQKASLTIEALKSKLRANEELWQSLARESKSLFCVGGSIPRRLSLTDRQTAIIKEQDERIGSLSDRLARSEELLRQYGTFVKDVMQSNLRPQS